MAATIKWPLKRLKQITSKIGSGATPRGGKNGYKTDGISLIRSLNVYDFRFTENDLAFIDQEQADELENVTVEQRDILLNITGASVARCCMVDPKYLPARVNQHVAIVRVHPEKADARFVLYCINSPQFKSRLLALAQGGATREALTKSTIEDFEVPQPPLPVQQRIGSILSAYDDLIENNTRRIQLLERMAQALYREWFVHFRFPGHAQVKRVASPLGPIPQGWEVVKFEDIYRTASGGTPSRKVPDYYGGDTNWVKTQELQDSFIFETDEKITTLGLENSSAKVFPTNTVLIAMYGATIGQLGILAQPAATNQACCAVLPKIPGFGHAFAFLTLLVRRTDLINLRQGAAQQNVSQVVIKSFTVLKPPVEIVSVFNDLVEPKLDMIRNLQRKNQILRRTRDLLLPKLISGVLDVSKLDLETGSGAK